MPDRPMPDTLDGAHAEILALRREVDHLQSQLRVQGRIIVEWKAKCAALEKSQPTGKGR